MADSPETPPGGAPADRTPGDQTPGDQTPGDQTPGDQTNAPRLLIQSQYVKDLSFENPRAPASLQPGQARPEIQIRVDVRARQLEAERYEVSLQLHVEAKAEGDTAFMVELTYGGVFGLLSIPQESLQPLLLIECPRLLFPFARRVVADATRDGGFPPLLIDPIDFVTIYRRRQQQARTAPQAEGERVPNPIVGDGASS
ncbi:MAG: protein-export chaperone SecB [Geminicoccaceae bacterium]